MNIPQFFGNTPVTEVWLLNCSNAVNDRVDETACVKQQARYSSRFMKYTRLSRNPCRNTPRAVSVLLHISWNTLYSLTASKNSETCVLMRTQL